MYPFEKEIFYHLTVQQKEYEKQQALERAKKQKKT